MKQNQFAKSSGPQHLMQQEQDQEQEQQPLQD